MACVCVCGLWTPCIISLTGWRQLNTKRIPHFVLPLRNGECWKISSLNIVACLMFWFHARFICLLDQYYEYKPPIIQKSKQHAAKTDVFWTLDDAISLWPPTIARECYCFSINKVWQRQHPNVFVIKLSSIDMIHCSKVHYKRISVNSHHQIGSGPSRKVLAKMGTVVIID